MKVIVLNGSPKGEQSITLFSVKYIAKHFPEDHFEIWNVGQRVNQYEKNPHLLKELENADLIFFAYPVYTTIAPAQLHRMVRLIKNENINLERKWMAQLTTSKKFFDFSAHRYIEDNANDLKMKVLPAFSSDMMDLTLAEGRKQILQFWKKVQFDVKNNLYKPHFPIPKKGKPAPFFVPFPECSSEKQLEKKEDFTVTIVADLRSIEGNLANMIEDFVQKFPFKTKVVNVADFKFSAGCLGCLRCTQDSICVQKDRFDEYLRNEVYQTDALVMAFEIEDHSFGTNFKMYDDRNFCFGHRSPIMGKPIGFLVSGNLSEEENLRTLLYSRGEIGHNPLAGVASDEIEPANSIDSLVKQLVYLLQNPSKVSQNFYGVGGHKIFRDLVFEMRGLMQSDHQFYKKNGLYNDFPSKKWKNSMLIMLVGKLMKFPKFRAQFNKGMLAPFEKALQEE